MQSADVLDLRLAIDEQLGVVAVDSHEERVGVQFSAIAEADQPIGGAFGEDMVLDLVRVLPHRTHIAQQLEQLLVREQLIEIEIEVDREVKVFQFHDLGGLQFTSGHGWSASGGESERWRLG